MSSLPVPRYEVLFQNQSNQVVSVALFQQMPIGAPQDTFTVAWLADIAAATSDVAFQWSLAGPTGWEPTFNFFVVPTLIGAEPVSTPPSTSANLTTSNEVTLSRAENGRYQFSVPSPGPEYGTLYILVDSSVMQGEALVGIGMAGAPAFLVPARPNGSYSFTPTFDYFLITAPQGALQIGQFLSPEEIQAGTAITFPPNVTQAWVTLNA